MLEALRTAARKVFCPTFVDKLSDLEQKIQKIFLEHQNPDARAVLIFCDHDGENLSALSVPHGVNAKFFMYSQREHNTAALSLVAALECKTNFENQWPLVPGLLDDLSILVRYPVARIPEFERKLPPATLVRP
jgi:hypothetical protein